MTYSISFTIPNAQIDPRLAGNSNYNRFGKAKLTAKNRRDAFTLTKHCLNGVEAQEFLTNCGGHSFEDVFPITLVCRRVFTGRGQEFDDDNIRMAFKAYRDGICDALGIGDDPKQLTGQYEQEWRNTHRANYLGFEVIPAWATKLEVAS